MNKVVVFGSGEMASLVHYYFSKDTNFEISAYTLDADYITDSNFENIPVIPFQEITTSFPPESYSFFVALSYSKMNSIRREKYELAKSMRYKFVSYISSKATVLNENQIGENCLILENNTIQPFVKIGNNVTLWSGNHIGHHSKIEDHNFISSHVVVSGGVHIEEQCFIGVNSTIRDHVVIGAKTLIGAGSIIMENTKPGSLYVPERTKLKDNNSDSVKKI